MQGKTTGAQRFLLIHGLGKVLGDYTPAALWALGDIGLLVMDSKERVHFPKQVLDYCLFLSSGDKRVRRLPGGRQMVYRCPPVGVITTIVGDLHRELRSRCLYVRFSVKGRDGLRRDSIEREIADKRAVILGGLFHVLRRYLQIAGQTPSPNPIPKFREHFAVLCDLLRAYGDVAGKPDGWAEEIIKDWDRAISGGHAEGKQLEHEGKRNERKR